MNIVEEVVLLKKELQELKNSFLLREKILQSQTSIESIEGKAQRIIINGNTYYITADGKAILKQVGIGRIPTNYLHVRQGAGGFDLTVGARDNILVDGDGVSGAGAYGASIGFSKVTGGGAARRQVAISAVQVIADSDSMGLAFFTHDGLLSNDNVAERMRIDHTGKVGIGLTEPLSKLHVAGAVVSGSATITASADDTNVSDINTLYVDSTAGNIVIGAFVGGVHNQHICVVKSVEINNVTLEHNEGTGNQNFFLHAGVDEVIDGHHGGWSLTYKTGKGWLDQSHAKHV